MELQKFLESEIENKYDLKIEYHALYNEIVLTLSQKNMYYTESYHVQTRLSSFTVDLIKQGRPVLQDIIQNMIKEMKEYEATQRL